MTDPTAAWLGRPAGVAVATLGRRMIEQCLAKDGSVLTPQREVWTRANLEELRRDFVDRPDEGSRSFFDKLGDQLADTSPLAVQLFAELLLLNLLPIQNLRGETKIEQLRAVLKLTHTTVAIPDDVAETLRAGGVYHGGQAFNNYRWLQLKYLIEFALYFKALPEDERRQALDDPLAFRAAANAVATGQAAQRQSLLYLAFPSFFLPIVSPAHRRSIRDAFTDYLDHAPSNDVDSDLHEINEAVMREHGGPFDFYDSPWKERWRPKPDVADPTAEVQHAWRVRGSNVLGYDLVPMWRQKGIVSLSARLLRPVEPDIAREELKSFIEEDYRTSGYAARQEKFDEFYAFLARMHDGDLVVTFSQRRLYFGTVTGDAEYIKSEDGLSNLRRTVKWESHSLPIDSVPDEVTALLDSPSDVTDLSAQIDTLRSLTERRHGPAASKSANLPDATAELAQRLHVPQAWLQECIDLLRDRPQLIFYGPPGTGKTYLAQEIAKHIAPDGNVTLVQFHPAYSYEDFFEGYRPVPLGNGQVGFDLKPGPLRRIVDKAVENPTAVYVLIIDEINRGNLAKIFGELYFLLEYRNTAIDLLYRSDSDGGFSLPRNLVMIGTMNTADRSIALVDAAMRRRFAFVPLHPSEPPTNRVLRSWLAANGYDIAVADLLDALNNRIDDPDFKIGPSYFMRPAVFAPGGIERVWRTAILPLLEEYHYGDRTINVDATYGLDAIRRSAQSAADSEHDSGPAADSD
ncbi:MULTISPECIES: McrB family protein [Nocardia]|uniref:AAA family ATPase n=1 Tax=Nocardia nova TaxID=37330 RepID=A0A2T2Z955_9NOCA|nr:MULTISPECIES: AAA family ATPase [Nocardia]PSR64259.1 AAA family ATPase [Nocardia nova]